MGSPGGFRHWLLAVALTGATLLAGGVAGATDRHFTYTYESGTLAAGRLELELWNTVRVGQEAYFVGTDHRLEFEMGLTDRLQTAVYLNGSSVARGSGAGRASSAGLTSVSSEWKYRLLDDAVHGLGLALYGELTVGGDEIEAEAKIILDRRFGNVLLAANLIFEHEWLFEANGLSRELIFEVDLAAGYLVTPWVLVGLEAHSHTEYVVGSGLEHSALFVGPVVSYTSRSFWISASVLPQIPALHGAGNTMNMVLDQHEVVNARVLVGARL